MSSNATTNGRLKGICSRGKVFWFFYGGNLRDSSAKFIKAKAETEQARKLVTTDLDGNAMIRPLP